MYPWLRDPLFVEKLLNKKEFYDNRKDDKQCLKYYQRLAANYINPKSPYNSLLLYMNVGTGKTLSSIAIAENFIKYTDMKILVITKNEDLVKNYITELLTVCSNYTSKEEIELFREASSSEKLSLLSNWNTRIKKYNFRHHEEFKKSFMKGELKNLNNKVIIIDEIHKMIGNKGYNVLFNLLKKSVNYRLVILSATPVFDNIIDIFQICNLFNVKQSSKLLPTDESELYRKGYINKITGVENISIFKDDKSIFSLTPEGIKKIKENSFGHILYVKSSPDDFPKTLEMGEKISIDGYTSDIKVIKCKMDPYQEERYIRWFEILKKTKDFNRNLEHASNMIYPDYNNELYIGNAGYQLYINDKKDISIFKESNIKKYSTKLFNLLQIIKKSEGKICIYSSYVNDDGIAIIEQLFKANGIGRYISLTGSISPVIRKSQIEKFNHKNNDDGSDIKILLFSSVLAEGITLKSVREIHIFEPSWNLSSLDQVIGRVYRTNSHSRLPKDKRTIKIYRYCALTVDYKLSSDLSKYIKSGRKDYFIKLMERELIKNSFLCAYTKEQNLKFSKQYLDGSRECEYQQCEYKCNKEPSNTSIDTKTYNTPYHDPRLHSKIKKKAIEFFNKKDYSSVENMVKLTGVSKEELVKSMRMLIKNKTLDVKIKGNYYIKTPKDKSTARGSTRETLKKNKITMDEEDRIYTKSSSRGKICSSYKKEEIIEFFKLSGLPIPNKNLTKNLMCKLLYKELKKLES